MTLLSKDPIARRPFKKARVLATLGPASRGGKRIQALIEAGANAFRLNCSHARPEDLVRDIRDIRRVSSRLGRGTSVMMDLQGPRLRLGRLRNGDPIEWNKGDKVALTTVDLPGTAEIVSTNYSDLPKVVSKGSRILVDDGKIELRVLRKEKKAVRCEVVVGGTLRERKGINLPGAEIRLPAVTKKDRADLALGLKEGLDYVALSFVARAADVRVAKEMIQKARAHAKVIAKIERPEALRNIDEILDEADGVMVARGDLAVELGPARVPGLQKQLVQAANRTGKMAIVATQMLESMVHSQVPTRAEASDVANAVFDGADAVMLSAESAAGRFPVEAVETMSRIIVEAESNRYAFREMPGMEISGEERLQRVLARSASRMSTLAGAKAVVCFTLTGNSARLISKNHLHVPVYALTPVREVFHQMALMRGIRPIMCRMYKSSDALMREGEKILLAKTRLKRGDMVLILAGGSAKPRHRAANTLKLRILGDN